MMSLVHEQRKVAMPSQAVDDVNGAQKNSEIMKVGTKFKRPPRAMALAIAAKVLNTRHTFHGLHGDANAAWSEGLADGRLP